MGKSHECSDFLGGLELLC